MSIESEVLSLNSSSVLTVSALNQAIFSALERTFPLLWVAGEVSNFTCAGSGHWYFSIKDEQAQIRCVMFRGRAQLAEFMPKEGDKIEIRALVSLYSPRGEVQLKVEAIRRTGQGRLFEAFLALKQRLEKEGLFSEQRKRAIPLFPKRIGVITSLQAAALKDVLTTLARRVPHIPILVYPVPVQGEGAAQKIALMIEEANVRKEVDILIVCRGGGSIEDLWVFNEECVARAVAASQIPIISGVGHETDFTIIDFVADQRAPTPTAAAEMVSQERAVLLQTIAECNRRMNKAIHRKLEWCTQQLDHLSYRLLSPKQHIARQQQQRVNMMQRLQHLMSESLNRHSLQLQLYSMRFFNVRPQPQLEIKRMTLQCHQLSQSFIRLKQREDYRVHSLISRLDLLNPYHVLQRGYAAVIQTKTKSVVRSVNQLKAKQPYRIYLAEGSADVTFEQVQNRLSEEEDLF